MFASDPAFNSRHHDTFSPTSWTADFSNDIVETPKEFKATHTRGFQLI